MNSSQTVVSDGSLALLNISFEYFDRTHVHVLFDGVEQTLGTTWSWVGSTNKTIQFSPAVAAGVIVEVRRVTPLNSPRHVYSSPGNAPFNKSTVDENFRQALFASQEAAEGASLTTFAQDVSAAGNKLTELGDAMLDGDAVSLKVLREYLPYGPAAASLNTRLNAEEAITSRLNQQGVLDGTLLLSTFNAAEITDGAWLFFAGRDSIGDGGGGVFWYDAFSTQTADGGTVFEPVGGGRIFREGWTVLGFNGPVNALWFGAQPTLLVDSSTAIISALAAHKHVIIPPGVFRCDAMIEVQAFKTLELSGGTVLRRVAANSASTDPVVWVKGSDASFIGKGKGVSTVLTENRCPLGAVSLGHRDMTQSHGDVTYSTLLDMTISGSTPYGQTTGQPDVSLFMCNPQIGGKASYFHNISGLRLQQANVGLWLLGWANGNTISNLQGYKLGNPTLPTANRNGFVLCSGALDNTFVGAFFHASPNAVGLTVETVDNRGTPGGSLHAPYANKFSGLVCEQGGASALALKILSGGGSYYEVRDNCAGGNSLYSGFYDNSNTFIQMAGVSSSAMLCKTLTSTSVSTHAQADIATERMLQAGAAYAVRKVKMTGGSTANASLSFTLSHAAQASIWRTGSILIKAQGGTRGSSAGSVAWYLYSAASLSTTYPTLGALKDSGGDTGAFTITNPSNGVITVASSLNDITVALEYTFTNADVNIS